MHVLMMCVLYVWVCLSLCSGPGGHHHSGLVHRDHVCRGAHCSHPPHSLLHQAEPRGEISRYSSDCSCSPVSSNNTLQLLWHRSLLWFQYVKRKIFRWSQWTKEIRRDRLTTGRYDSRQLLLPKCNTWCTITYKMTMFWCSTLGHCFSHNTEALFSLFTLCALYLCISIVLELSCKHPNKPYFYSLTLHPSPVALLHLWYTGTNQHNWAQVTVFMALLLILTLSFLYSTFSINPPQTTTEPLKVSGKVWKD